MLMSILVGIIGVISSGYAYDVSRSWGETTISINNPIAFFIAVLSTLVFLLITFKKFKNVSMHLFLFILSQLVIAANKFELIYSHYGELIIFIGIVVLVIIGGFTITSIQYNISFEEEQYKEEREKYVIDNYKTVLEYVGKCKGESFLGIGEIEGNLKGNDICKIMYYSNLEKKEKKIKKVKFTEENTTIKPIENPEGNSTIEIIKVHYKKVNENMRNPYVYDEEEDKIEVKYILELPDKTELL